MYFDDDQSYFTMLLTSSDDEIDVALHQRGGKCSSNPDSDGPGGSDGQMEQPGVEEDQLSRALQLLRVADELPFGG